MKKLLLLCSIFILITHFTQAQDCVRDSTIIGTTQILSPRPYSDSFPQIATAPVCINEPYIQSVTLNVPATFTLNGITAGIDSIVIATTGAITNLPVGLNYTCNPPNCHFQKESLGCILLSGTATPNNTVGLKDLGIKLKIHSPLLPFPIDLEFPGTIAPGQHFYLQVKEEGQCAVSTNDLHAKVSKMAAVPNPFGQQTTIQVTSEVTDRFQFEVFNILGEQIHSQAVELVAGENKFTFDAGDLANGSYYFSLRSAYGRATRTFVIQR